MQTSRSLFQTVYKDPQQPLVKGVRKSRPFFNAWAPPSSTLQARAMSSATSFYDFKPLDKKGQPVVLADYKDQVVLVVNTASKCGFTPQYEGLEKLFKSVKDKYPSDFTIIGFPCNQFGSQEPGTNDDIQSFCQVNYGVSFPIMGKTQVNGDKAEPLYEWMKKERPGIFGFKRIKWNFEKFLIGRDGKVVERWASIKKPQDLESVILAELKKGGKTEAAKPVAVETEAAKPDAVQPDAVKPDAAEPDAAKPDVAKAEL